jgi:hypothetical protein
VAHSPQQGSTVRNHLLAALSPQILSPLLPKFSSVDLPVRQVLHAPEAPIEAVYFPQTGMVPLVAGMEEGGQGGSASSVGRAWSGCRSSWEWRTPSSRLLKTSLRHRRACFAIPRCSPHIGELDESPVLNGSARCRIRRRPFSMADQQERFAGRVRV